jgi:hypothetical protein
MAKISGRWMFHSAVFFVTLLVVLLVSRHMSSAAKAPRVEYRVLESLSLDNNAKLEAELNQYGQTGWELVLVDMGNVTKPAPRFIFKRVEEP